MLRAICWARELGLPVQINTTITRRNLADFEAMARLCSANTGGGIQTRAAGVCAQQ